MKKYLYTLAFLGLIINNAQATVIHDGAETINQMDGSNQQMCEYGSGLVPCNNNNYRNQDQAVTYCEYGSGLVPCNNTNQNNIQQPVTYCEYGYGLTPCK